MTLQLDAPDTAGATVALRRLDWDTDFFGATMGAISTLAQAGEETAAARAEALARDLRAALEQARAEGYAHVIFRAAAEDPGAVWAAEAAGLRLVDVGVDNTLDYARTAAPAGDDPRIRPFRESDLPALRELAADSFVFSRFALDPFFTREQVREFHRTWITNLCNGLAQAVLVCEIDGVPAGFVSCAMGGEEGRIPLIATHGGYRRAGIGRALVDASLRWFREQGARVAHVKTQAHNYPALGLYHRAGFAVSKSELTFSIAL